MALLHRAQVPDWSRQPKAQWNRWQRLAARSHGILTPGNFVSILSSMVVLYGLYLLTAGTLLAGVLVMTVGRLGDILDGLLADYTKTKSPLGESVDSSVDKLLLGLTCLVLLAYDLVPMLVVILLLARVIYNAALAGLAAYRKIRLHPSATGKLATAFEWACIGGFILRSVAQANQQELLANLLLILAYICGGMFVALAGKSSWRYTRQIARKTANA